MRKTIAVTMRTPGNDAELAAGFLFTEGIIRDLNNIQEIKEQSSLNKTTIVLKEGFIPDLSNADRNFIPPPVAVFVERAAWMPSKPFHLSVISVINCASGQKYCMDYRIR